MDWDALDVGLILFLGHLALTEKSVLRKYLLYLLARYVELPFLRFGYRNTKGDLRFLYENQLTRLLLKKLFFSPIGRRIDTGHPMPTEDVLAFIDAQDTAIAVGPCRCRTAHGQCRHRLETDIVIRTGTDAFTKAWPQDYRHIDREEAKEIVTSCAEEGMWHMVFIHCPTQSGLMEYAVCNCCTDGCVPYLLNKHFGQDGFPLVRGEHIAQCRPDACRSCGECLKVCPWEARTMMDGNVAVDLDKCFGCGLCARVCPNGGVAMLRERVHPPWQTNVENSR